MAMRSAASVHTHTHARTKGPEPTSLAKTRALDAPGPSLAPATTSGGGWVAITQRVIAWSFGQSPTAGAPPPMALQGGARGAGGHELAAARRCGGGDRGVGVWTAVRAAPGSDGPTVAARQVQ